MKPPAANENEIAPTAAPVVPLVDSDSGSRTAEAGRGHCPRSAQTISEAQDEAQRAARDLVRHGIRTCDEAAKGDPKRRAELLRRLGEKYFIAAMNFLAESDPP